MINKYLTQPQSLQHIMTVTKKLNFACVDGDITALQDIHSDVITVTPETAIEGYVFATYTFENNVLFGNAITHSNQLVLDIDANVINVCIQDEAPTPTQIFTALENAASDDISITSPTYDADVLFELHSGFGVEETAVFRNGLRGFNDGVENINPENVIEKHTLNSSTQFDEVSVSDINAECNDNEYFIEEMWMQIPELHSRVKFVAPSIIVGVPDSIDNSELQRIHDRFDVLLSACGDSQTY